MRLGLGPETRIRQSALLLMHAAAVLVMFATLAAAQTTATGTTGGTVSDETGAIVNGAKVTITNKTTGQTSTLTTDANGNFVSGPLTPTDYAVRVDAKTFVSASASVEVKAGVATPVNFTLSTEPLPGVVSAKQIDVLPLNNRSFLESGQLEPGVQNQDGNTLDPAKAGFSSISLGGRWGRAS